MSQPPVRGRCSPLRWEWSSDKCRRLHRRADPGLFLWIEQRKDSLPRGGEWEWTAQNSSSGSPIASLTILAALAILALRRDKLERLSHSFPRTSRPARHHDATLLEASPVWLTCCPEGRTSPRCTLRSTSDVSRERLRHRCLEGTGTSCPSRRSIPAHTARPEVRHGRKGL